MLGPGSIPLADLLPTLNSFAVLILLGVMGAAGTVSALGLRRLSPEDGQA